MRANGAEVRPGLATLLSAGLLAAAVLVGAALIAACSSDAAGSRPGGSAGPASTAGGTPGDWAIDPCATGGCLNPGQATCDGSQTIVVKGLGRRPLASFAEADECTKTVDWVTDPPESKPPAWKPPEKETFECAKGSVRLYVKDIWSKKASPTLGELEDRPLSVVIADEKYQESSARQVAPGCEWYVACVPAGTLGKFHLASVGANACSSAKYSGTFDGAQLATATEAYLDYAGSSLQSDYQAYPNVPTGASAFRFATTAPAAPLCPAPASSGVPAGFTKLHIRWLWGDPDVTGYPGTGCGQKAGPVPPYPTSLKLVREGCAASHATLERQDGECPWYSALIPNDQFKGSLTVRHSDEALGLYSPQIPLPSPRSQDEYWLAYRGAPDNNSLFGTPCMNWSQRGASYNFYTANPGPGWAGCGGDGAVKLDPCNPPVPDGFSVIHFRYMWAGQKTFTFFPKPELMPQWMVLEVDGGDGSEKDVVCYREQDRPWFNCPVPNSRFKAGATWRAVDKTRSPEWNTVKAKPFPEKPGEYWLRWYYGKPDIPETSEFKFYDHYPDGSSGDWSATGDWDDKSCADKPPATPVKVGYGGWFPYDQTGYAYAAGASLARTFSDPTSVQDLLNYFVQERYERWRDHYVVTDKLTCGEDTARVKTDPPDTVSEGQGYGIVMAAAMGDKPTFVKLWNFVRHFLSQSSKKYCGGLMGWMWDGALQCRKRDMPCDPDKDGCGGNQDSAFDGDVDIGIGLVYAARQWPEYRDAAIGWLSKMECEVNATYDGKWFYPTPGDTWDKNCSGYPGKPCNYEAGRDGKVNLSYYPPGYFRVFGDFLKRYLDPKRYPEAERERHRRFWYKTAETVYEMVERCYDEPAVHPALVTDWGSYTKPCSSNSDNYNWARFLFRVSVDAAWFGNRTDLPENVEGSSSHYAGKSRMKAKIDNIQDFFATFRDKNPTEKNANRFSTICQQLSPDGQVSGCDPAYGHNSYFVNNAMAAYVPVFDDGGKTTPQIRREALEEAVSATVINDKYYQESLGVYTMLFLTGNFPNPMEVR